MVPYAACFVYILVVGGVHGWVGVRLLRLLFLVPHNHLHRLGPRDLSLLLLSLVVVHSSRSLSFNVGQVLKSRHLDNNWRYGWRLRSRWKVKGRSQRCQKISQDRPRPTPDIPTLKSFINSFLAGECSKCYFDQTLRMHDSSPSPFRGKL